MGVGLFYYIDTISKGVQYSFMYGGLIGLGMGSFVIFFKGENKITWTMGFDINQILNSSFIVYFIIGLGLIHIYLKKTGKTFVEIIKGIRESIQGVNED